MDNQIKDEASGRQMNRREFGTMAVGAGAAVVTAGVAHTTLGAQPVKGGTLRVALSEGIAGEVLNPHAGAGTMEAMRAQNVFNRLVHMNKDGSLRYDLAESAEPNATADEWVFKLRKGVEFHDGKSLTANDVLYSISVLQGDASSLKGLMGIINLANSSADGKNVVRLKLNGPNADLPYLFQDWKAQIVQENATFDDQAIGTGAFRIKEVALGERTSLERNPNYWRGDTPHLDAVEAIAITESVPRMAALFSDDVQLIENVEPEGVAIVRSRDGVEVISSLSGRHLAFQMDCQYGAFKDVRVRTALKLMVDRERIVRQVLQGEGSVGNDTPISSFYNYFCDDLAQRPYDPDQAKSLLKQAGAYDEVFPLSVAPVQPGLVAGGLLVKEMAAEIGVKVEVIQEPGDSYWSAVWQKKPWVALAWNGRPTVDMIMTIVYDSRAAWNDTNWRSTKFDAYLDEARGTIDSAKRQELYCAAQRLLNEDGGALVPAFMNIIDAKSSHLKGLEGHPIMSIGMYQFEDAWLES